MHVEGDEMRELYFFFHHCKHSTIFAPRHILKSSKIRPNVTLSMLQVIDVYLSVPEERCSCTT